MLQCGVSIQESFLDVAPLWLGGKLKSPTHTHTKSRTISSAGTLENVENVRSRRVSRSSRSHEDISVFLCLARNAQWDC